METKFFVQILLFTFKFLPYLWGMETLKGLLDNEDDEDCSYRTYEEWKLNVIPIASKELYVLTVPMRNGNWDRVKSDVVGFVEFLPYLWGMETSKSTHKPPGKLLFLPYLWGMETILLEHFKRFDFLCSYRTYEEWKRWMARRTYSRNGSSYRTYEEWKLWRDRCSPPSFKCAFLPYLWGMETSFSSFCSDSIGCSYRTYEEWKRSITNIMDGIQYCSYRTYEEWKLFLPDEKSKHKHPVLTVPMRNGNTWNLTARSNPCIFVLTVPMRNGNEAWQERPYGTNG